MNKSVAFLLMLALSLSVVGCAKKTASEQLREDMEKAAKQVDKEVKGFLK